MGKTIGEGGMGVVRAAKQLSLGREVAVKSLRREQATPAAIHKLLQEALITGALEHPDIIPVYALGQDEAGVPMLVACRSALSSASVRYNASRLLAISADCPGSSG